MTSFSAFTLQPARTRFSSAFAVCLAALLTACAAPTPPAAPAAPAAPASVAPVAAAAPAAKPAPPASGAVAARETIPAECLEQRAPTGSNMVRRDRACVALTEEERAAARRELEEMRAQQGLKDANRMGGSGR